jgi:hypothetical protein
VFGHAAVAGEMHGDRQVVEKRHEPEVLKRAQ